MELIDRLPERSVLDGVLRDVRVGQSRVLVLHGEAGIGKSALMEYVGRAGRGLSPVPRHRCGIRDGACLRGTASVVPTHAGHLDRLPPPQCDALCIAFGMSAGPAPDRFLIGLAVLSLFSEMAEVQPLVCLVDDMQWIDETSAHALSFVGRRLGAESVG
jgi:AAA ATPase domain